MQSPDPDVEKNLQRQERDEESAEHKRADQARHHPDSAKDQAVPQHEAQHVGRARAERKPDGEFVGALGHEV